LTRSLVPTQRLTSDEVVEGEIVESGDDIRLSVWRSIDKDRKAEFRRLMQENGANIRTAALKAGLNEQVIRNMVSWGRTDPKSPAAQLARDVDRAMADKEHQALTWLYEIAADKKNFKAVSEYLAKLNPDVYGERPTVNATQVNISFEDVQSRLTDSGPGD
jgi:hypothetical protein